MQPPPLTTRKLQSQYDLVLHSHIQHDSDNVQISRNRSDIEANETYDSISEAEHKWLKDAL